MYGQSLNFTSLIIYSQGSKLDLFSLCIVLGSLLVLCYIV